MMRERGAEREVAFAAQKSRYAVVPELAGASLTDRSTPARRSPP
jgi:hypothetical protein